MCADDALVATARAFEARMRGREIHLALHEELMADLVEAASAHAADAGRLRREGRLPAPTNPGRRSA